MKSIKGDGYEKYKGGTGTKSIKWAGMKKWGGDCERNKFKEAQKERNKHDYFHNLWSDKSGLKGTDVNQV